MHAITVDVVDLVADRTKSLGARDRRELAEAIVQRLGFSVEFGQAVGTSQPAGASMWMFRAQQLREHPMRQTQLPDAVWDAFKHDIGAVDVAPFAGTPATGILATSTGELPP